MMYRYLSLLIICLSFGSLFSQPAPAEQVDTTLQRPALPDEMITKRRMDQHERFKNREYQYPARPRNMWEVGLSAGIMNLSGDVRSQPFGGHPPAFGFGVHVRKGIGYVLSIRGEFMMGTAYGQNWQASTGIINNKTLTGRGGDPALNYLNNSASGAVVYHNFKTKIMEGSIQLLGNFNNIKFHKDKNVVSFYGILGVGGIAYETFIDQLDGNGQMYDYSDVLAIDQDEYKDRKDVRNELDNLVDYEYESKAESHGDDASLGSKVIRPSLTGGLGMSFLLHERISIALEHRLGWANDDLLDGQQWTERNELTSDGDIYHYTSLHLNLHLGKKSKSTKPTWYVNPLDFVYDDLKSIPDLRDADGDGVPNHYDKEPNTDPDAIVSTTGETMDSDKDGCPDHEDPEPLSSPQWPIEDCVNTKVGLDEGDVRDIIDTYIQDGTLGGLSDWYLPMIHFDLNKDKVKPEFYPSLRHIADVMKRYPDLKVEVIGHADDRGSEEHNDELSKNRAQAAIKHIAEKYSVSESRFVVKFEGENSNLYPEAKYETEHYMNRRCEFRPVVQD